MIIGGGLIARAFEEKYHDAHDVVIFASGVSNSQCSEVKEFERDKKMINDALTQYAHANFIYFSTTSLFDENLQSSPYVEHKRGIENFLLTHPTSSRILILRLPIVAGVTQNQHTLLNFLVDKISSGSEFKVFAKAFRNIIDIQDVVKICNALINSNSPRGIALNLCNPKSIKMTDLVPLIEDIVGKKAIFSLVDKGGGQAQIDISTAAPFIRLSGVEFGQDYIFETLKKYYSPK
jgi:nucleoside-diphosphate-sugar epimerase